MLALPALAPWRSRRVWPRQSQRERVLSGSSRLWYASLRLDRGRGRGPLRHSIRRRCRKLPLVRLILKPECRRQGRFVRHHLVWLQYYSWNLPHLWISGRLNMRKFFLTEAARGSKDDSHASCSPQVSRTPFPAGFLARRSQHDRHEPFHLPQRMAEWNFETVYLVTVAGPRWDFTSFPIKPFLGHLRTP